MRSSTSAGVRAATLWSRVVPARGASVVFAPGGTHLMLAGLATLPRCRRHIFSDITGDAIGRNRAPLCVTPCIAVGGCGCAKAVKCHAPPTMDYFAWHAAPLSLPIVMHVELAAERHVP
jgi:hypothetical protein